MNGRVERRRELGAKRSQRRDAAAGDRFQQVEQRLPDEWRLPRRALVEHGSERILIGARAARAPANGLGRQIRRRAEGDLPRRGIDRAGETVGVR
jgi:hypothetical protein